MTGGRRDGPPIDTCPYPKFDRRHFELFARAWATYLARNEGKPLTEPQMRLMYEGNPAGESLVSVAEADGEWIGAISALPMYVSLAKGARAMIYQLGDLVVDPRHQGRGLGRRLAQDLTAALCRLRTPVFGFPNRRSVGIFRKEKYLEPRVIPTVVYSTHVAGRRRRHGERVSVREISVDDACLVADSVAALPRSRPRIEKSGTYLRWRYARMRDAHDYHFSLVERGSPTPPEIVVWTVFPYRGIRFQVVVDSVVAGEAAPHLRAAAAQAVRHGAWASVCHLERAPGWGRPPLAVRVPARLDPRPAVLIVPPDDGASLRLFDECLFTAGDWLGF
jgi:GNAT superfamily N-acetyltransferase